MTATAPGPAVGHRGPRLDGFLALCARLAGRPGAEWASLGRDLLTEPEPGAPVGGASELNNDGCPVQLCLVAGERGCRARLVADPAWWLADPAERLAASRLALAGALRRAGAGELAAQSAGLLGMAAATGRLDGFRRGFVWIGAAPGEPGVAAYLDAEPFGAAAWDRARDWVRSTVAAPAPACRALEELARDGELASLGLEGARPGEARTKLYWRLRRPVPLRGLGLDLLADPALTAFLARVVGPRRMNLSGAVLGLGVGQASGAVEGVKLDLCGHCLARPAADWARLLDGLTRELGLARLPLSEPTLQEEAAVAFVGLGVDAGGARRLNVYLRPPAPASAVTPATRAALLRERAGLAVGYLAGVQRADGSWVDYRLPVGPATQWVTAFTGLGMAAIAAAGRPEAAAPAARAAAWLRANRTYDAGWGYNERTGVDADSTGLALRLQRAVGLPVEARDETRLAAHWRRGGGIATYADGPLHWDDPHPCVTAVAFPALAAGDRARLLAPLVELVERTRRPDGTWPAYWWRTHWYSTYHHLALLRRLGRAVQADGAALDAGAGDGATALELAYACGSAHLGGRPAARVDVLLERLLDAQRYDGRWPGGPDLRVTDPACARPWDQPRGDLYVDHLGTITTASALLVIAGLLAAPPGGEPC